MSSSTSSSDPRPWRRFLTLLVTTAGSVVAVVWLFVVLVDPFGRLPISLPFDRGPVDSNARYAFPMLARDARFDSVILGTSTMRLLRPASLNPIFDARFANLAMNSATLYEQARLLAVFLGAHASPRAVMFGIDPQNCIVGAPPPRVTDRQFPEWLYGGSPWAGYREMADFYSIEKAGQAFAEWTGLKRRVYGRDGYTRFVPDDSRYDPMRVAELMRGAVPYFPPAGMSGPVTTWPMPNIDLLRAAVATIPAATQVIFLVVPVNHRMLPEPGTSAAVVLDECKRRLASLAGSRDRVAVIDFMVASPITLHDENYWDPFHYRVGIAERVAADIARARDGGQSDDFRLLAGWNQPSAGDPDRQ